MQEIAPKGKKPTDTSGIDCPHCGEPITAVVTRGPDDHRGQCGHQLSLTIGALAGGAIRDA